MTSARLVLAFGLAVVLAPIAAAADVSVLCIPAMRAAMDQLGPRFEMTTGHKLSIRFGLPSHLNPAIEAGSFDLAVFNSRVLDGLIKQHKVVEATRVDLGRVAIGVAVRAGAPKPDITSVDAFKRTLLGAKSISYTKDSATGAHLASVMQRLGIAEDMRAKTKLMQDGGQNPRAVAAGEVELGISLVSDILPEAGVELLGLLPADLQQYAVVTLGIGATAKEPHAASELIRFLTAPAAAPTFKATGLEPLPR